MEDIAIPAPRYHGEIVSYATGTRCVTVPDTQIDAALEQIWHLMDSLGAMHHAEHAQLVCDALADRLCAWRDPAPAAPAAALRARDTQLARIGA